MNKIDVSRRQLGTALALYLDDNDPVAVHCLACGGGEIAEGLTRRANQQPFFDHVLLTFPERRARDLRKIRNQYWNVFKHATDRDGVEREDEELLANFDDSQNDHALFIGWYDYMLAVESLPIEAQVHQIWYFAKYPEKLNDPNSVDHERVFPDIKQLPRAEQKERLRGVIASARNDLGVMRDPKTDLRSLILR